MSVMYIANIIVCIPQMYFLSLFFCKFGKLKYQFSVSFVIALLLQFINWLVNTYWNASQETMMWKLLVSIACFFATSMVIYEGSVWKKMQGGLFIFGIIMLVERICSLISYTYLGSMDGSVSNSIVIARNAFNSVIYVVYVLMEIIYNRKRSKGIFRLTWVSFLISIAQFAMIFSLVKVTAEGVISHLIAFTTIYSVVVILGHQITISFISKNIEYQQNQYELEQKAKERQYQYNYYLLAKEQGEEIRNVCHDIRNQLQTIQFLIHLDGEEEKERAEKMLVKLEEKILQE